MRKRWATQADVTGHAWSFVDGPTIAALHNNASGQALPQSSLIGFCSGQHGMSSGISMPAIVSMPAETEDAIALSAAPMLMGPTMIPSRAATKTSLCNVFQSFM
jgi:hypothetical protein